MQGFLKLNRDKNIATYLVICDPTSDDFTFAFFLFGKIKNVTYTFTKQSTM